MMLALSIRQPWAWLIVHGGKTIENRRWNTRVRGEFLIHAAKGMSRGEYDDAVDFVLGLGLSLVVPPFEALLRCGIVGRGRLVDVLPPCSVTDPLDVYWRPCAHTWHMPGQFGFVLSDVEALPFRPLRGELGFFRVAEPAPDAATKGAP